ncbi:unnamed protein product [Thlaspi arvense]|uniref:Uncharacterized protein n=1 Tax=Thlaspi arvense TaxID=13288 RepID=A0AAU9SQ29_THLAR|nr:unnamed protein product [Thlaspi arvense]
MGVDRVGKEEIIKANTDKIITGRDEIDRNRDRTDWDCLLRHGANPEYFFDLEVYKAANSGRRCGQLRVWRLSPDAIYTKREEAKPLGFAVNWKKK